LHNGCEISSASANRTITRQDHEELKETIAERFSCSALKRGRHLTFDTELKGWKHHESSDSLRWVVHPVRALLASGRACADSLSNRLADIIAVTPDRHHDRGCIRADPGLAVSSRPRVGLEET
jgi:hypothetical protein